MLLWIKGNLNLEDLRAKIMSEGLAWQQKMIAWLESCHSNDLLTGLHAAIFEKTEALEKDPTYVDPPIVDFWLIGTRLTVLSPMIYYST
jgi:hypothetical protein